jgi:hypothetical protein
MSDQGVPPQRLPHLVGEQVSVDGGQAQVQGLDQALQRLGVLGAAQLQQPAGTTTQVNTGPYMVPSASIGTRVYEFRPCDQPDRCPSLAR